MDITKKYIAAIAALMVTTGIAAQTSAVKKVAESVFTLTTFNKDGALLNSCNGVFVGNNGEAISDLSPFTGATSAVAIDSKGNKHNVTRIMGGNEIYNVVKFRVDGKTKPATSAASTAQAGAALWLVPYTNKSAKPVAASVKSVEQFMDKYQYYILNCNGEGNIEGCPFVNDNGEIVGIFQSSPISGDIHATDANFILSLTTNGLSVNDDVFRKIGIPTALPAERDQAILSLMLTGQLGDSIKYAAAAEDFINSYPELIDGYSAKAQICTNSNDFDGADKYLKEAISRIEDKDNAHYNYAKFIYLKEIYKSDMPYSKWNLDLAMKEIASAYSIKQLPLYKDLEGQILFAKGEYGKAYDTFMDLTSSSIKGGDLYYNAALCKQQLKAPDTEIIALLDSAVNNADTLNFSSSAKYYLMRADLFNNMGDYRKAVFDYARYEIASGGKVNAEFYYKREQIEVKAKLFKQALSDIDKAIYLSPQEPIFMAEKAALQLRLNMFKEAIASATKCIETAPDFSDAHLILGLAKIKNGEKAEGMKLLEKAKGMGNSQAQTLIEKYSKQ